MTLNKFFKIFKETDSNWNGDNAYKGLMIIAKYLSPMNHEIIAGADHDVIYSVDVQELIEGGITEEDVEKLARLNWGIDKEDNYLMCFV